MELSEAQERHREWLIGLILSAKSLTEIGTARQELDDWLRQHPGDVGLTDGFDHLAMSCLLVQERDATLSQAA